MNTQLIATENYPWHETPAGCPHLTPIAAWRADGVDHGIWLRDRKRSPANLPRLATSVAVVLSGDYPLCQYIIGPVVQYQHPMSRWWNLLMCGGWYLKHPAFAGMDQQLLASVAAAKKPMATLCSDISPEQVHALGPDFDVLHYHMIFDGDPHPRAMVGDRRQLGEIYDLTGVARHYTAMFKAWAPVLELVPTYAQAVEVGLRSIGSTLQQIADNSPVEIMRNRWVDADGVGRPGTPNLPGESDLAAMIITGLCLGYPVESTFDRLVCQNFPEYGIARYND